MAGRRTDASHCPNQCWFIVKWTLKNNLQWKLNRDSEILIPEFEAFKHLKMSAANWRPFFPEERGGGGGGGGVKMKPLPGIRPTVEIQNTFQLLQLISLIPIRLLFGLTYRGWDKMAAISQTNHSNAFSWVKLLEFRLKFNWSLFPRVQFTTFRHWFW